MSSLVRPPHYFAPLTTPSALHTVDLTVTYGEKEALYATSLTFPQKKITSLIGASGSGKSTFLRCLNRLNDRVATVAGQIFYHDWDINHPTTNVYALRREIGMVFQRPNPFYKSIAENITFALKKNGLTDKKLLQERLETSLKDVALWDEVKDDLTKSALALSGGQQQRLCIARALALQPEILLLDEPASALDPISTAKLEETLLRLKKDYTIIMVTHNMQQAARASDYTAFFQLGEVLEFDTTTQIFTAPHVQLTEDYVTGHFG
ncbi:phosphate ABC transporter ATP-binding protein PstB [Enterococcus nangangensis]|uniref:phosphate ABC transporter ATP-binding protein PstB n=1 Tax=Enterococcus nangangensis TaxID=2559926 RepID=UPI0010F91717|nr:phosphate ABC transporter ATP-binding protein PstB [Enterococcus nangangensis]